MVDDGGDGAGDLHGIGRQSIDAVSSAGITMVSAVPGKTVLHSTTRWKASFVLSTSPTTRHTGSM